MKNELICDDIDKIKEKYSCSFFDGICWVENELNYPVSVFTMVLLEKDKRMAGTKIIDGANPQYNLVKTLANYFNVPIEYMMGE